MRSVSLTLIPVLGFAAFLATDLFANPVPSGYPNKGALISGTNISAQIRKHPLELKSVSPPEFQYGTDEMASALLEIGTWGSKLQHHPVWVGDISKKGGGKLAKHLTHQRGLDVDIAYLVRKPRLQGHRARKFHDRFTEQFGLNGKLGDNFRLEENYQLLSTILKKLDVSAVFVGCAIYDAFEAYDRKQPVSVMRHIFAQKGHEDHFHVRLRCPRNLPSCSDDWWTDPSKPKPKTSGKPEEKYRDC